MQVIVTAGLAGNGFAYEEGDIVAQTEFSKNVGEGWRALCAPLATETAVRAQAPEVAIKPHRRRK